MDARTYFEQQSWWHQEKSLWVKARLAEQNHTEQAPGFGMSEVMLLKITKQVESAASMLTVLETRKLLIKLSAFNQKLYDILLDKALKLADKDLIKLLMYYHPEFLTIEQYQSTMRNNQSKSPAGFMLWLSTCINPSADNSHQRIQQINARYSSLQSFKTSFISEHTSLEALSQALENTQNPEVFSFIWDHWPSTTNTTNPDQRFIEANNDWRIKLATRAIELKQVVSLEKIITAWPEHCNKPEELIQLTLTQLDSINASLLIQHDFDIPENAHILLMQQFQNSFNKITTTSAYKSEKKYANEVDTPLVILGVFLTSLSIILSSAVASNEHDYVIDKLKNSPPHQLYAFSDLALFILGITSFYYGFIYSSKILAEVKNLESNYIHITNALIKKQTPNEIEAIAAFDFLYSEESDQNPGQVEACNAIAKAFNETIEDPRLHLAKQLASGPKNHHATYSREAYDRLSKLSWWQEETTQWDQAREAAITNLLDNNITILTDGIKNQAEKKLKSTNKTSSMHPNEIRLLFYYLKYIDFNTRNNLKADALLNKNQALIKLLLFYEPELLSIENLVSTTMSLSIKKIPRGYLLFLADVIELKSTEEKNRFQHLIVEHGDLELIQNSIDEDQLDLSSLKLAAKNIQNPEVFMYIFGLCKQKQFITEISGGDYQQLVAMVFAFPKNTEVFELLDTNNALLNEDPFLFCFDQIIDRFKELRKEKSYINSRDHKFQHLIHSNLFWCCLSLATIANIKSFYNIAKGNESPAQSFITLFGAVTLFCTWPFALACRNSKSFYRVQTMKAEFIENTKQLETTCLIIISKLSELGFKPSHNTLEYVAESFHQGVVSEIVYQKYFEAADNRIIHNNAHNNPLNQGLYGQAKQGMATNIFDDLTQSPSV